MYRLDAPSGFGGGLFFLWVDTGGLKSYFPLLTPGLDLVGRYITGKVLSEGSSNIFSVIAKESGDIDVEKGCVSFGGSCMYWRVQMVVRIGRDPGRVGFRSGRKGTGGYLLDG